VRESTLVLKKPWSWLRSGWGHEGVNAAKPGEEGSSMGNAIFRVKTPDVMHETIEGEVIIINLLSGTYYSVSGSGAEIWALLQSAEAVSSEEIAEALGSVFDCSRAELERGVTQFLDELLREGLVADAGTGVGTPRTLQLSENGQTRRPFEMPMLEKYTDMQDLVLIDPVHQVDEAGWPRRPDAATQGSDA
jgi:Coenzyme PQQ synthesis protein D (PqqD)